MSSHVLPITEPMTIDHAQALAATLLEAIEQYDGVDIDLGESESIDLAGVQVLLSAALAAEQRGVAFRYLHADRYRSICEYSGLHPLGAAEQ